MTRGSAHEAGGGEFFNRVVRRLDFIHGASEKFRSRRLNVNHS